MARTLRTRQGTLSAKTTASAENLSEPGSAMLTCALDLVLLLLDESSIPTGGVESQKKDGGGIAAEVLSVGRRSGRETETVGMGEG